MEFFKNRIVRIVSWILLAVGGASLILGGITTDSIFDVINSISTVAVSLLSIILGFVNKSVKK